MIGSSPALPATLGYNDTMTLATTDRLTYNLQRGVTIAYITAEVGGISGEFEFKGVITDVAPTSFEALCTANISGPGEVRIGRILSSYGVTTFRCDWQDNVTIKKINMNLRPVAT